MAIYETFSKRQKKLLSGGIADPYQYDIFPQPLRVQLIALIAGGLGNYGSQYSPTAAEPHWDQIHDTLANEYGIFKLTDGRNNQDRCIAFFLSTDRSERCLDLVEMAFRIVYRIAKDYSGRGASYV